MDDRTARRVTDRPLSGETHSSVQDARDRAPRSLLSSSMVGTANRGLVLQALFDLRPTSRAELARHAGINRTTISGIVQPLIDGNVLVETGPSRSTRGGGKPGRPLWFSPNARPICGVLLMPGAVQSCLVTLDGAIIGENRVALQSGDGPVAPIIKRLRNRYGWLLRRGEGAARRRRRGRCDG